MPGLQDIPGGQIRRVRIAAMAGATSDDEQTLFVCEHNLKVVSVNWVPDAAVSANGTNFTTLTVQDRGAADGSPTTIASRSYAATNATQFEVDTTLALSGTAANLLLASGDVITVARAHSGTGIALPAGLLEISCQFR